MTTTQTFLIISELFGTGAEGICTKRLAMALSARGFDIEVCTASAGEEAREAPFPVVQVPPGLQRPARLFLMLARLSGRPLDEAALWRRRAVRMLRPAAGTTVIGRGSPLSSLLAAEAVARRWGIPLLAHFSDPIPGPWESEDHWRTIARRRAAARIALFASGLSFTTPEAVEFQSDSIGPWVKPKAVVLRHIVPPFRCVGPPPGDLIPVILYLGTFYLARSPMPLLEGFRRLLAATPARLWIAGPGSETLSRTVRAAGLQGCVALIPEQADTTELVRRSSVLVSVDAPDARPVFLPTKVMDYCLLDRPVVAITPRGSPTSQIAERFPATLRVCGHEPTEIAATLAAALQQTYFEEEYRARERLLSDHSADAVCAEFARLCGDRIPRELSQTLPRGG
jgi:hypothetical protein